MIYGLTLSFCSSGLRRCDKCAKKPPESLVIPSLESLRYIKTLFGKVPILLVGILCIVDYDFIVFMFLYYTRWHTDSWQIVNFCNN